MNSFCLNNSYADWTLHLDEIVSSAFQRGWANVLETRPRLPTVMNFKRNRDTDPVQRAGSHAGERGGALRRIFGGKRGQEQSVVPSDAPSVASSSSPSRHAPGGPSGDASVNSGPGSDQLTKNECSLSKQSLWDRAYEALGKESPDLVTKYQNLLEIEAQAMGTHHLQVVHCGY